MPRTTDQVIADENLTEAIIQVVKAYEFSSNGIMTDYVVVVHEHSWDDEGDETSAYLTLLRDGGGQIAWHRIIGLLRTALIRTEHNFTQNT